MSHTITANLELKNEEALRKAVEDVGGEVLGIGEHQVYSGKLRGFGFKLKGWNYPVVVEMETGEVKYDNFGGNWGNQDGLDHFMQRYTLAVAQAEADEWGFAHEVVEAENGDLKLLVTQLGAAPGSES